MNLLHMLLLSSALLAAESPSETVRIPMRDGILLTVDLGPCAATIAPGHRLQVDICGSLFPLYDRNPNTAAGIFGKETAVALEQVHHSPGSLSRLNLPLQITKTPQ